MLLWTLLVKLWATKMKNPLCYKTRIQKHWQYELRRKISHNLALFNLTTEMDECILAIIWHELDLFFVS